MINQEFRNRWADGLESGKYTQGFGTLNRRIPGEDGDEREYCCLGVACELLVEDGILQRDDTGDGHTIYGPAGEESPGHNFVLGAFIDTLPWQSSVLPPAAYEYIGIDKNGSLARRDDDGYAQVVEEVPDGNFQKISLITLNDGFRKDFRSIAKVIRGVDKRYELEEAAND